ncbi:MAG: right-handed parallel beta-helix repeat-containing protein [Methanobrevibacter sp.]|nr:right-handed parallel beta-helix repeat-containing protein [Candidatus Methanoflexus mossambicus]
MEFNKSNKFILIVLLISIIFFVFSGVVGAASEIDLNDDLYSSYFDDDGNILTDSLSDGDTLKINGDINNKKFIISKSLNVVGSGDGKLYNSSIKVLSGGSGTNISNLNFENYKDDVYGVYLFNSTNNMISNCNFLMTSKGSGYGVVLAYSNYNIIKSNNFTMNLHSFDSGMDPRASSGIVLGGSSYNTIERNILSSNGSNPIYLSGYGFLDFSTGKSEFNNIIYNTVYSGTTTWCYAIQIMGNYNNISYNNVNKGNRGISDSGSYNIISFNNVSYSTNGIIGGNNGLIFNNNINGVGNDLGIQIGSNSKVYDNTISVINGNALKISNSNNVNISFNQIHGESTLLDIFGQSNDILISFNNFTSKKGTSILITKQSKTKYPKNIIISENTINSSSTSPGIYSINALESDDSLVIDNNNIIAGSILSPSGEIEEVLLGFNGITYNITNDNFYDYFESDGKLKSGL